MSATSHLVYDQTDPKIYSDEEKRGVTILILCSCISSAAVLGLLATMATLAVRAKNENRKSNLFFRSCIFVCFVFLLLCNLVQGIASAISVTWVQKMVVSNDQACFFQGLLTQLADLGMAIWTMIILVQAFCRRDVLMLKASGITSWAIYVCGWSLIVALSILGPITVDMGKSGPFYAVSGHECWISPHHKIGQIVLDRLIMYAAILLCLALCPLVFLRHRRTAILARGRNTLPGMGESDATDCKVLNLESAHSSNRMLIYPVAYTIYSLPLLIAQLASWTGHEVSFNISLFCTAVYQLSGFANVILFFAIRAVIPRVAGAGQQCLSGSLPHDRESGLCCAQILSSSHRRTDSNASDATLVSEVETKTKTKLRPPDIIITRDSFETVDSVYSLHEEDLRSGREAPH